MSLQTAVVSGTSFIHNLGYLSGGRTGSLEMLVLCDELAGMAKRFAVGIKVNEDTLAVEIIRRAYKDCSFLMNEHTRRCARTEMWQPALFRRASLKEWRNSGADEMQKRVREKLMDLLHSS
ncbi:MAG: hypothetical protein B6I35_03435 [Anaerolineaceae bacterium 4572_32.2]|nr:MAG: hypothetical protein B6I35_03435 [Anaerolineaceae bacterium 4572_32.2]